MRFPKTFQRRVGGSPAALAVLGSDSISIQQKVQTPADCQFATRLVNINGFPAQRIVVAYMPPTGLATDPALPATLYMQCFSQSDDIFFWVAVPSLQTRLAPCTLTFFDTPSITDAQNAGVAANPAGGYQPTGMKAQGSTQLMLVVSDPGGTTAGAHTFMIGTDFSNPAFNN